MNTGLMNYLIANTVANVNFWMYRQLAFIHFLQIINCACLTSLQLLCMHANSCNYTTAN